MALLSRRTFLRGAAGAALALPVLEVMGPRAYAQSAPARRLVIFQFPNGVFLPDWFPQQLGTAWTPSLLHQRQPDDPAVIDDDLASVRGEINLVSGISNSRNRHDAHVSPNNAFLTGGAARDGWAPLGPSVDEVAGAAIGAGTVFPVLRLSIYQNLSYADMSTTICFGDDLRPLQPMTSARTLYGQLTGLVTPSTGGNNFAQDFRRSVLDAVRGDIDRLRARCGIGDRRILDEHFDSVRDLESRIVRLEPVSCELPDLSAELAQLQDPSPRSSGHWPDNTNAELLPLRSEVMQRIAVLALRCDLTRVVVLSMGPSSSRLTYPFLGMGNTDDHYYSHLQRQPSERAVQLQWNRLTRWKMSELAKLIRRLQAPDATGASLLDETILVAGSELANGAGHTADLLPIVVAGNVGSMASARGRHLTVACDANVPVFNNPGTGEQTTAGSAFPAICGASGYTPLSNLWLTALRALGVERASFGDSTGTVPDLWI